MRIQWQPAGTGVVAARSICPGCCRGRERASAIADDALGPALWRCSPDCTTRGEIPVCSSQIQGRGRQSMRRARDGRGGRRRGDGLELCGEEKIRTLPFPSTSRPGVPIHEAGERPADAKPKTGPCANDEACS